MKKVLFIVLAIMLALAILGFYRLYKAENGLMYDINIDKTFKVLFEGDNTGLSYQVEYNKFLIQVPQDSIILDINKGEQKITAPLYYDVYLTGVANDVYVGTVDVVVKVEPNAYSPTLKQIHVIKVSQGYNAQYIFGTIASVYEFVNNEIDSYFGRAWIPFDDSGYQNAILWLGDSISFTLRGAYLYIEYILAPIKLIGGKF